MKYRLDYSIKNNLQEKKYLNMNSDLEALTVVLKLTEISENVQAVRLKNIDTDTYLIKKPNFALGVLDLAAEQLTHHLNQKVIDRVK